MEGKHDDILLNHFCLQVKSSFFFCGSEMELNYLFTFLHLTTVIFPVSSSKYRLYKPIPAKVELREWSANKIIYFFFGENYSAVFQSVFFG